MRIVHVADDLRRRSQKTLLSDRLVTPHRKEGFALAGMFHLISLWRPS